jgi:hypothetical protein
VKTHLLPWGIVIDKGDPELDDGVTFVNGEPVIAGEPQSRAMTYLGRLRTMPAAHSYLPVSGRSFKSFGSCQNDPLRFCTDRWTERMSGLAVSKSISSGDSSGAYSGDVNRAFRRCE